MDQQQQEVAPSLEEVLQKKTDFEQWLDKEKAIREEGFSYYSYGQAKMDPKHLSWIVPVEDINVRRIIPYNIFTNIPFYKDIYKLSSNIEKEVQKYEEELTLDYNYNLDYNKRMKKEGKLDSLIEEQLSYSRKALRSFLKLDYDTKIKTVFCSKVRSYLRYYFWSKSQCEIVVTSWPAYITREEVSRVFREVSDYEETYSQKQIRASLNLDIEQKLSIYDLVMMNWEHFIEYLWMHRRLLKAPKYSTKDTK